MIATVLASMIILGGLAAYIAAYQVAAKTRYRDHARYVIKSLADQFLTQRFQDSSGNTYPMFVPTGIGATSGTGLTFIDSNGASITGNSSGLVVSIGDNVGSLVPLTANVTREVNYMTISGSTSTTEQNASAGYLLQGTFYISYVFPAVTGKTYTHKLTVVRAVP